jgi:hypothetical protein
MATWHIVQTEYVLAEDNMTNVINLVHWRAMESETVGEETYTASSYGTQSIGSPDLDNYTPYDQVTEAECLAWCKAEMGAEQVTAVEDGLTANIELQKNPVDGHGVPW